MLAFKDSLKELEALCDFTVLKDALIETDCLADSLRLCEIDSCLDWLTLCETD